MTDPKEFLQRIFINFLVSHLFNSIGEEDILLADQMGRIHYKGKVLDEEMKLKLQDDAEKFLNSAIWKILSNEVKYQANQRMFDKGLTASDILAGKCALFVLDILEKKMEFIRNLK